MKNRSKSKFTKELYRSARTFYEQSEFEKAITTSKQVIANADSKVDHDEIIMSLLIQLESYRKIGEISEAWVAAGVINVLPLPPQPSITYLNAVAETAEFYIDKLEYSKASESLFRVLPAVRDNKYTTLEGKIYSILSFLNYCQGKYTASLVFSKESLKIPKLRNESVIVNGAEIQMAVNYIALGDHLSALDILDAIEKRAEESGDRDSLHDSLVLKCDIFRALGDLDKAYRLCMSSIAINEKHKGGLLTDREIRIFGSLLTQRKEFLIALNLYSHWEEWALESNNAQVLPMIYTGIASVYNNINLHELALSFSLKAVDVFAPYYFEHQGYLEGAIEQLKTTFGLLDRHEFDGKLLSILANIKRLKILGVDASEQEKILAEQMREEVADLMASIKAEERAVFSRDGLRIDLRTGDILGRGKRPLARLTPIQLRIITVLVGRQGIPVSNADLIRCYEERVDQLEGMPRRAHYYISEIRKKLGKEGIIRSVKGEGYMIPSE